ncbi:NAD(P)/FAD-dependent oxidoreductase [Nocardia sp. NPDC003482]
MPNSTPPWRLSTSAEHPPLRGRDRCDVAVVGAGLTGLSTALAILERDPGARVVVLEARRVGAGASGRGTGLLGPRVGPSLTAWRRRHGDGVARAAHLWSVRAVAHAIDVIRRHGLDCDLVVGGQLVVARDAAAAAALRREAEAASALELPIAAVPSGDLPEIARRYRRGLRYPEAATLDPGALTAELARRCAELGARIHEGSAARSLRHGTPPSVVTADGELVADRIVLCVNAFGSPRIETPSGVLGFRVQAGATAPLSGPELAAVESLRAEPIIESGDPAPYFRLMSDGRLIVGGGAVLRGVDGHTAPYPERLRGALAGLSPHLAAVRLDAAWSGPIAVTRDGLPVLGRHRGDDRILHASGCNGHGLAVCLRHGAHLADLVLGREIHPLMSALPWLRAAGPWIPRGALVDRTLDRYLAHLSAAFTDAASV